MPELKLEKLKEVHEELHSSLNNFIIEYEKEISLMYPDINGIKKEIKLKDVQSSSSVGDSLEIGYETKDRHLSKYSISISLKILVNKNRDGVKFNLHDFSSNKKLLTQKETILFIKEKRNTEAELLGLLENNSFKKLIDLEIKRDELKELYFEICQEELLIKQKIAKKSAQKLNNFFKEKLTKEEKENLINGKNYITVETSYDGQVMILTNEISTTGYQRKTFYIENANGKNKKSISALNKNIDKALKYNGKILTSIEDLQKIFEPNLKENYCWSVSGYMVLDQNIFKEKFDLKLNISEF